MELGRDGKVLLRRANAEVYQTNPFRVLRLPPNATTDTINRCIQELRIRSALNLTSSPSQGAVKAQSRETVASQIWWRFVQECEEITLDDAYIQKIIHRLQDPEERLIDEFLWFWVIEEKDKALEALWRGNASYAITLWRKMIESSDNSYSFIARHNLAVMYHLLSLELETHGEQIQYSRQWKAYWYESWQLWLEVVNDEGVWNYLTQRVLELKDPRVNQGTINALRKTTPLFLALINAKLALGAFQKHNSNVSGFHLRILNNFVKDEIRKIALTYTIDPIVEEIKILLQTAKQKAKNFSPAEAAEWLIKNTHSLLTTVSEIFPDHPQGQTLRDEIALQVRAWANESIVSGDISSLKKAITLLERAVELSGTQSVRDRLAKEVNEAKRALEVTPFLDRLATLIKEAKNKAERGGYWLLDEAEKLLNEAHPMLYQLDLLLVSASDRQIKTQIRDAVAVTVHALIASAIKSGNRNFTKAKELLEKAIRLAASYNIVLFLQSELKTLDELIARQQQIGCLGDLAGRIGSLFIILLIGIVCMIWDWWTNRAQRDSERQIVSYSLSTPQQLTSQPPTIPSVSLTQQEQKPSESNLKTRKQWIKYLGLEHIAQKYIQGRIEPTSDLNSLLTDLTYESSTVYPDKEITGDLNNDGHKEKIVIIRINAGGSGTFVYLIVLKHGKFVDVKSLGDRVIVNSVFIKGGYIVLDMLTFGPNDSMAKPTKKVIVKYKLIGNRLMSETDIQRKKLEQRISQLKSEIERGKERLIQLTNKIIVLRTQIETLRSQIQAIEQANPWGFTSESDLNSYRALVRQHNELVEKHNALAREGRALLESLKHKAAEHDQLVVKYNSLLQEE